jgi:hypothetical protein
LHAVQLLRLLRIYQSIVASRPLEQGNREFLVMLVRSIEAIRSALTDDRAIPQPVFAIVEPALARLRAQAADNAAQIARANIPILDAALHKMRGGFGTDSLYVRRSIVCSERDYSEICVVCGPGLGMGDEITFLQFFRALVTRQPNASLTFFNLYPGLWRQFIPSARHAHYRGRPTRPIEFISHAPKDAARRSLVVVVDFDAYNLHAGIIPKRARQDVLEISLGYRTLWFARGDSAYVDVEHVERMAASSNYEFVETLTRRVLGATTRHAPLTGLRPARPVARRRAVILVNALSSKPVPLATADWHAALVAARRSLGNAPDLHACIYPGLDPRSLREASALQRTLARERGITASVLTAAGGRALTPFNAVDALVAFLRRIDVCLTIDTFTAHLVPLFGIPTLVIALKQNREFWVPVPQACYCLIQDFAREVPAFLSQTLRSRANPASSTPSRQAAARALTRATEQLHQDAGSAASIEALCAKLTAYLMHMNGDVARASDARRWLRYWSRLTTATRREPLASEQTAPLIRQWEVSEFFKRAALEA